MGTNDFQKQQVEASSRATHAQSNMSQQTHIVVHQLGDALCNGWKMAALGRTERKQMSPSRTPYVVRAEGATLRRDSTHLGEGQAVDECRPGFCQVLHVLEVAAPLLAELHDGAHVVGRRDDLHPAEWKGPHVGLQPREGYNQAHSNALQLELGNCMHALHSQTRLLASCRT